VKASFTAVESIGLVTLIIGTILSNLAVSKMAKIVRIHFAVAGGGRVFAADRRRQREAIRKYREKYGNGPLFRYLLIAYGLVGIGGVVLIFGGFILKP